MTGTWVGVAWSAAAARTVGAAAAGPAWTEEGNGGAGPSSAGVPGSPELSLEMMVLVVIALAGCAVLAWAGWFRVRPGTGARLPLPGVLGLFGFAGALVIGALVAQMALLMMADTAEAGGRSSSPLARMAVATLTGGLAQLGWMCALLVQGRRLEQRRPVGESLSPAAGGEVGGVVRPAPVQESLGLMLAATLLAWPGIQLVAAGAAALERHWTGPMPELGHETLRQMADAGQGDAWWWVTAFCAVALAPCMEELLYRGLLQQGIKRLRAPWPLAVACTAVIFALLHWGALVEGARLSGLCLLGSLGLLWGWLYERTGRLSVCMLAHALFNAINLLYLA